MHLHVRFYCSDLNLRFGVFYTCLCHLIALNCKIGIRIGKRLTDRKIGLWKRSRELILKSICLSWHWTFTSNFNERKKKIGKMQVEVTLWANGCGTVVEHSTADPEIEGSNPAATRYLDYTYTKTHSYIYIYILYVFMYLYIYIYTYIYIPKMVYIYIIYYILYIIYIYIYI
jgi:hypothetical protein